MAEDGREGRDELGGTQVVTRPDAKTKQPSLYKVLLLNDDFTPKDFVVHVLQKFFKKNETEATQLMLDVHNKGVGIAGVYPFEIAETKTYQVNAYARENKYPLKSSMEET